MNALFDSTANTSTHSYARVTGILITIGLLVLVFATFISLVFVDICNPTVVGTEIREVCMARFNPGAMAAYVTAAGGVMSATTVLLYRENKRANHGAG